MKDLPKLPRQNKRKEAKVDHPVLDWFLKNYKSESGGILIEVKIKGNKALQHQEIALLQANQGRFKYKFPDMGKKTPGDGVVLKPCKCGAHPEGFTVTCDRNKCHAVRIDGKKEFDFNL